MTLVISLLCIASVILFVFSLANAAAIGDEKDIVAFYEERKKRGLK